MKNHCITFGGKVGSGKSSAAKGVAVELGYTHYSCGDFMRQISKERGLDFVEFNKILETTSTESTEINKEIDERARIVSTNENNVVMDGHIAFHFAVDSFKVYLDIDDEVAAKRVHGQGRDDEHGTLEDFVEKVTWRNNSMQERFIKLYKVDIRDTSQYDLVINSGLEENDLESVIAQVTEAYKSWLEKD